MSEPLWLLAPLPGELERVPRPASQEPLTLPSPGLAWRWAEGGIAFSGVGRRATRGALEALAAAGARRVLHLGCAGGLRAELRPGDAFWITGANHEDQRLEGPGEDALRERLSLPAAECVTVRQVAGDPAAKQALAERFPAAAVVEMETYWAIEAAAELGLTLSCLRVVVDRRDEPLPDLSSALDSLGRPKPLRMAWKIVSSPRTAMKLPGVAKAFGAAQDRLAALARLALAEE